MRIWPFTVMLLIWAAFAHAQEPVYYNYHSGNGLPSNEVYNIRQDAKGYLWLATDRGLSRFDGNGFVNYSINDGLGTIVTNDLVLAPNGDLWAVGDASSLYRYTGGGFEPYRHNHVLANIFSQSSKLYLSSIAFEGNRPAWFCVRNRGLFYISEKGQIRHDTLPFANNTLVYDPLHNMPLLNRTDGWMAQTKRAMKKEFFLWGNAIR